MITAPLLQGSQNLDLPKTLATYLGGHYTCPYSQLVLSPCKAKQ